MCMSWWVSKNLTLLYEKLLRVPIIMGQASEKSICGCLFLRKWQKLMGRGQRGRFQISLCCTERQAFTPWLFLPDLNSLCGPDWPQTCYIPVPVSRVLRLYHINSERIVNQCLKNTDVFKSNQWLMPDAGDQGWGGGVRQQEIRLFYLLSSKSYKSLIWC